MFFKQPVNTTLALSIFAAPGAILLFGLMPSLIIGASDAWVNAFTLLNAASFVVMVAFWILVPSPDPNETV